ncbi:MAG TPA: peptidase M28, partial [Blastocatellia bacterium]|nr:peptidase M28 [Blastocatellia bacterium]
MKRLILALCTVPLIALLALAGAAQKRYVGLMNEGEDASQGKTLGPPEATLNLINADGVMTHIKTLSSDLYEGRGPGTPGENFAIAYIADQFKQMGLAPGNTDGKFFQDVPLVGLTTKQDAEMKIKAGSKDLKLKFGEDFVARTVRITEKTGFDADMVFVGYGVEAPEYGWDDYKGMDVRGKTIVMLINDPPVRESGDTSRLDSTMFRGSAMTYYGRWTYKYEEALRHGARGVIIIHTTPTASYGWDVVRSSWGRENPYVKLGQNEKALSFAGWVSKEAGEKLLGLAN